MKSLILLAIALLFSLNAFTADEAASKSTSSAVASKGKDTVVYEKKTTMDFDGRSLDGDIVNPNGAAVEADKNLYFDSMFEGRQNFKSELKRSSGALR